MKILELLLPQNTTDKTLSAKKEQRIDVLKQRMTKFVDKIGNPATTPKGREFLKAKLVADYTELKKTIESINEEKVNELFTRKTHWEWARKTKSLAMAYFTVGDIEYVFVSEDNGNDTLNEWNMSFKANHPTQSSHKSRFGVTGTGNSVEVMSTVVDIIRSFLEEYKGSIDIITFTADESSRSKLYAHMVRRLLPNWKLELTGPGFTIHAPTSDKLTEAIHKLPLTDDDFELVKDIMSNPIPACVAPIFVQSIIEDDELFDQLQSIEDSEPNRDVRPLLAEWFKRVMPDQLYRFGQETPDKNLRNGRFSLIHGYNSNHHKGSSFTGTETAGNAYGRA